MWIAMLATICLTQGLFIYSLVRSDPRIRDNIEEFSNHILEKFGQNNRDRRDSFDGFIDDGFSRNIPGPFGEMGRFQERMEELMGKALRGPFRHSWGPWYEDRSSGGGQIQMESENQRDAYIVTLSIEDLKDHKLDISIDETGILVEGDYTQIDEKKDSDGNIMSRRESRQSIVRRFTVPGDVIHEKAEVKRKKDQIIIELPKHE